MPIFSKAIGIVGGAGPMASSFLYRTILRICQTKYNAADYKDFPEIILVSYPFTRGDQAKIQTEINLCFSKLVAAGANLFCIASNSFHGSLPDIKQTEFVHLVQEGLKAAAQKKIAKALIFAAQGTIDLKLYEQNRLACLYPSREEQQLVNRIIREVAGGTIDENQSAVLKNIIASMHKSNPFDGIILGCTELPLVHQAFPLSYYNAGHVLPVIDTVETLAEKLVERAL